MLSSREKVITRKTLSHAEFDVMSVIWRSGKKSMLSTDIHQSFVKLDWTLAEVMTYLKRLESKGYIICDRTGRRNKCSYTYSEAYFISKLLAELLEIHNCTFYAILKITIEDNIISPHEGMRCKELLSHHY